MKKMLGMKRKAPHQCDQSRSVTKVRKTFSNWDVTFPWLQKLDAEGQLRAVCTWCIESKKNNAMGTTGTPNLQTST